MECKGLGDVVSTVNFETLIRINRLSVRRVSGDNIAYGRCPMRVKNNAYKGSADSRLR